MGNCKAWTLSFWKWGKASSIGVSIPHQLNPPFGKWCRVSRRIGPLLKRWPLTSEEGTLLFPLRRICESPSLVPREGWLREMVVRMVNGCQSGQECHRLRSNRWWWAGHIPCRLMREYCSKLQEEAVKIQVNDLLVSLCRFDFCRTWSDTRNVAHAYYSVFTITLHQ